MERMKICFLVLLLTCAQPAHAWLYTIVGGIAAAVVAPYAIPAGLATIGFTSLGILKGSIAAGMMANIGGPVVGLMQAAGAAGIGAAGTTAAAGMGVTAGAMYEKSKKSKDQK
ncbi:hypothetical protein ACJMK2_024394 [Sinanodonta woodiana]|uniref:Uncharacterized protein n=1 Tax=Sinanodonta woodiana TaxID=1069815 RepID=A0ABD3T889_SINWO